MLCDSAANKKQVLYHALNTNVPTRGIIDYQDILLGDEGTAPPKKAK